jgi:hypothetical protein
MRGKEKYNCGSNQATAYIYIEWALTLLLPPSRAMRLCDIGRHSILGSAYTQSGVH